MNVRKIKKQFGRWRLGNYVACLLIINILMRKYDEISAHIFEYIDVHTKLTKEEIADSMSTVLRYLSSEDGQGTGNVGINYGQMLARREELLIQVADT